MKKLILVTALALVAFAINLPAQVSGHFGPGLEPTIGYHELYGYAVCKDANGVYVPIGMPDLSATAPTNQAGKVLTDYFTGNTPNIGTNFSAWNTNTYWTAAYTVKQTNGVLMITSTGVDSVNTYSMRKTIPYATNDWSATMVVLDQGLPAVNVTNTVSTLGLGVFYGPALTGLFVNLMTANGVLGSHTAFTNSVLGVGSGSDASIWLSSCEKPTAAQTNAGLATGINVTPATRGPVALGLSYAQSTKTLTFKAGSVHAGVPVTLSTIGTATLVADPTNIVISLHDYDATGSVAPAYTRVIKSFQFEQSTK